MSDFLGDTLRRLSSFIQTKEGSFQRHNAQYSQSDKLEYERTGAAENELRDLWNSEEYKLDKLINGHPEVRAMAVDMGSGTGWISSKLSKRYKKVLAIEPSAAAIEIAKRLYPNGEFPNIEWRQGFAEDVLGELNINAPALFLTGVVLSHLRDKEVKRICEIVNTKAPTGSILCFDECWGIEWHQQMWHVRTKEWWQKNLDKWQLDFHGAEVQGVAGRHKGIHGIKVR